MLCTVQALYTVLVILPPHSKRTGKELEKARRSSTRIIKDKEKLPQNKKAGEDFSLWKRFQQQMDTTDVSNRGDRRKLNKEGLPLSDKNNSASDKPIKQQLKMNTKPEESSTPGHCPCHTG